MGVVVHVLLDIYPTIDNTDGVTLKQLEVR